MKRIVLPATAVDGERATVSGKDVHYLAHVRRVGVGDTIEGLCEDQRLVLKTTYVDSERIEFEILDRTAEVDEKPKLTLFPFLLKARKLDDVVRTACEAGVQTIVPVSGDHCIAKIEDARSESKKLERWRSIAKEAAQQSGSSALCQIHPCIDSRDLASWWNDRGPLIFFHQVPLAKTSLHRYLSSQSREIGLVVGPEGGFSTGETDRFRSAGALPAWLGPSVLRAETASIYAVAAVQILLQEQSEWSTLT